MATQYESSIKKKNRKTSPSNTRKMCFFGFPAH